MRILTIISGIMMVLTGLWSIANQGVAFAAVAFVLGTAMVLNGLVVTAAFVKMKKRAVGLGWVLSDALVGIILGSIVLAGQLATDLMILMFFGMWMIFCGCSRLVGGWTLKKQEDKSWEWTLGLGFLATVAGIYSFLNADMAGLTLGILIGIFFLIQGANVLTFGISMPHVRRRRFYLRHKIEDSKGAKDVD
ncbi:hypothetical protein Ami103574_06410 [Aminipila butyrica]|uniref:Acid-resistance membrane protein n=1 Tax=Aminipila butyrica TaxID=433296 RepID=A0A858BY28_9FIRM|nr:DUF308 domain-containing protein [Aminipila butyrica]QIB68976.1 hypothetical protein Ami103574_06410 [Aminipila butyrica]